MDKFQEEKLIMEYFRKCYIHFPKGKLIKSESPDFILKINPKKSYGIELTRLVQSESLIQEQIQLALDKKQKKIALYQKGWFQQLWLILHADQIYSPIKFLDDLNFNKSDFKSGFDQIFIFDLFEGKVYS